MTDIKSVHSVTSRIYHIRGLKVMVDRDLGELYGVETKAFKHAVRRNIDRFPNDFMFEFNKEEFTHWRSQIVTFNIGDRMGLRHPPKETSNIFSLSPQTSHHSFTLCRTCHPR